MRFHTLLLAGTLALMPAAAANAAHTVIYGPGTASHANSAAHQGPHIAGSEARVSNTNILSLTAGPGGSASHDTLSPVRSGVAATLPGFNGQLVFGSATAASADLGLGRLKVGASAYGPNNFGTPMGFARAQLSDTLYFTNTSGGDVGITIRYSFDGSIIDSNNSAEPGGRASLQIGCDEWRCYNDTGTAVRFAGTGTPAWDGFYSHFDEGGIRQFSGDQGESFDHFDAWQSAPHGSGGAIDGWMQTDLLIPTGLSSLGIRGILDVDCRGGSNCNFGHTGQFGYIGGLPDGLTIGSASGVFLAGSGNPGGVPEPATWAMLILGFGTVGIAARRRRTAVPQG